LAQIIVLTGEKDKSVKNFMYSVQIIMVVEPQH